MREPSKRLLYLSGCALAVGGIAVGTSALQSVASSQNPTRVSFIAQSSTKAFDKDGNEKYSRTESNAYMSDGSSLEIRETVNSQPSGLRIIRDFQRKKRIVVDPATSSITTYDMKGGVEPAATVQARCDGDDAGMLLGFKVVSQRKAFHTNPGQTTTVEERRAPALGCYPLYHKSTVERDGSVLATSETSVTSVVMGDIASSELIPPSTFAERKPSEVLKIAKQQAGRKKCLDCEAKGYLQLDSAYDSAQ